MLTLFTWGYWGWGGSTTEFVQAVDATERAKGFRPPVFIDIRVSRNVRAKGFSGGAFGDLLTGARYHWEQRLGNQRIATGGNGIQIADASAAKELLSSAMLGKKERRHVIFFCACEFPRGCHRGTVARLVLREAEKLGRHVEIVEWPGGAPAHKTVEVSPALYEAVIRGRKSVPLRKGFKLNEIACLPWGSIVTLKAGQQTLPILTGPAKYRNEWLLPVLSCGKSGADHVSLKASSQRFRKEKGVEPRRV